jgi:hypothetical protein
MNRRGFFSMLAGLPFVGAMFRERKIIDGIEVISYPPAAGEAEFVITESGTIVCLEKVLHDRVEMPHLSGYDVRYQSVVTWISVEERLPCDLHNGRQLAHGQVLMRWANCEDTVSGYWTNGMFRLGGGNDDWPLQHIAYWAELPKVLKAPKGKSC